MNLILIVSLVVAGTSMLLWQPAVEKWEDQFSYRRNWRGMLGGLLTYPTLLGVCISTRFAIGLPRLVESPWLTGSFYVLSSCLIFGAYLVMLQALRRRMGKTGPGRFYIF